MAYQNEGFTGLSFTGDEYTVIGAYTTPPDGAYQGVSYTADGYTGSSYTDVGAPPGGVTFIGTGTRSELTAEGFSGGFPFDNAGSPAQCGTTASWAGFNPDPGGILDNDFSDDGPLSYTVLTQPGAGTLTTYAGGAFTWDITPATPEGRYQWTYGLYVNGTQQDIGTVTMIHGDEQASVGVQGFAGTVSTSTFDDQGSRASLTITGFAGDLTLNFDKTGTAAAVGVTAYSGTFTGGFDELGTRAEVTVQGFAGFLTGTFAQAGTAGAVTVTGNAGTLDVGTFFNEQGSGGSVTVTGFAGTVTLGGGFTDQGTAADVTPLGNFGTILFGYSQAGSAASVSIQGFAPVIGSANISLDAKYLTPRFSAKYLTPRLKGKT